MYSAIYNPPSADELELLGSLVETAIFSQWMHDSEVMNKIYYARWQGGKGEVDIVFLGNKQKPDWCVEVKWSDRNVKYPDHFSNLINFCRKNNIKSSWITTKSESSSAQIGDIKLEFVPSSLYCFMVGYNLVKNLEQF